MNTLQLKLKNNMKSNLIVELDGKRQDVNFNDNKWHDIRYSTEESTVHVKISTEPSELLCHHWFLRFLYYYLISFLGIFDWFYDRSGYGIAYEADIVVRDDTRLILTPSKPTDGGKVFKCSDEAFVDNESNKFTFNKVVKKRFLFTVLFKVVSWLIILLTAILIIIL